MLWKYSGKSNVEVIFKRGKMVFFKMMGCRKPFVGVQRQTPYIIICYLPKIESIVICKPNPAYCQYVVIFGVFQKA